MFWFLAVQSAVSIAAPLTIVDLERLPNNQLASYTQLRISALQRSVADRSTPERAVQSFFRYLNDREEVICLESEVWRREQKGSVEGSVRDELEMVRDKFFTGLPLKRFHQFDGSTLRDCLNETQTYSYNVVGVEPVGQSMTKIEVLSRNTTPLKSSLKLKSYELEGRKNGFRYRFHLEKVGLDWRIGQIEEKHSYDEGWSKKFDEEFLGPIAPYRIPIDGL